MGHPCIYTVVLTYHKSDKKLKQQLYRKVWGDKVHNIFICIVQLQKIRFRQSSWKVFSKEYSIAPKIAQW